MAQTQTTIKILIADGNPLFRHGLRSLLAAEPDFRIVAEAGTLAEGITQAQLFAPDVCLLDAALLESEEPGAGLCLRQADLAPALLCLGTNGSTEELQRSLSAGARAYMPKASTPGGLIAGIRRVAAGCSDGPNSVSIALPDLEALAGSLQNRKAALTPREQEIARLLAEGCTARGAAYELGLSVKTVEAHKLNLMRKLGIHDRASLITCALESGLIAEFARH